MARSIAPKRVRQIAPELPDEILHYIFLKLDFASKINAGQVCKTWDRLLKASSAGAKHWGDVYYNVDSGLSSQDSMESNNVTILEHFETGMARWIANRAGAIENVTVVATLSEGQQGTATMRVLESSLPLLTGCLSKYSNTMDLLFRDGSPFTSPLLSSSDFLTFVCPMVKSLAIDNMRAPIPVSHFAAMCKLSMLESLHIYSCEGEAQSGLQEMTEDISKLVNLTTLNFGNNPLLGYIPEAISSLKQLEHMYISGSPIKEVPFGLGNLANLTQLQFNMCGPLRVPRSLQGLKRLTSVALTECHLRSIPEALCGVPSLTLLDLNLNQFVSRDGWPWWPTTLSRLTNLETLDISFCGILSLPPHISGLRGLKVLHVDSNKLSFVPDELSCLQSLENLQADRNHFATVPISVLSMLTTMSTINLSRQSYPGGPVFHVSSSLLPILHPGLEELDLSHRQWDPLSLCHLGRALVEVANRTPSVKLLWRDTC